MRSSDGKGELLILIFVFFLGFFLSGGLLSEKKPKNTITPTPTPPPIQVAGACCDKGDGDACKPFTDDENTFTYNNEKYGLIRSNTTFTEGNAHLKNTGEKFKNRPIIINTSDEYNPIGHGPGTLTYSPSCLGGDAYWDRSTASNCFVIPNEQLVFVCKENCVQERDAKCEFYGVSCYGKRNSVYDVYFRLKDTEDPGVPSKIKNCGKSYSPPPEGFRSMPQQLIPPKNQTKDKSLQINTFTVEQITPLPIVQSSVPWFSPWCKPAIYLYPEKETQINVTVLPVGPMILTIPPYPQEGWNVTAYPNGNILNSLFPLLDLNVQSFDYLYYEAQIPDKKIEKPIQGYSVQGTQMKSFLSLLLPKLGLNEKESRQFTEYWTKTLPASPYYFVGIINPSNLDSLAPLYINPLPKTTIRVSLYFQALDATINVQEPTIKSVQRTGFTVVEWGGIFKKDKAQNFSCLM